LVVQVGGRIGCLDLVHAAAGLLVIRRCALVRSAITCNAEPISMRPSMCVQVELRSPEGPGISAAATVSVSSAKFYLPESVPSTEGDSICA
jgi:hypothetical protein